MVSRASGSYDSENYSEDSDGTISIWENQNDSDVGVEIKSYNRKKPKSYSKNAQMARESRLKKKIYVAKLEKQVNNLKDDKSRMKNIIESQSFMLNKLKNEVKYLKNVLSNSSDICKLLRNINQCTGMDVSTSLNKTVKITNECIKGTPRIARKTLHPWEENEKSCCNEIFTDDLDLNINDNDLNSLLLDTIDTTNNIQENEELFEEHNYTRKSTLLRTLGDMLSMLYLRFQPLRHLDEIEVDMMSIL